MKLVFDIETDDLKYTKIWCIVAIDENKKLYTFGPDKIEEGIELLSKATTLIGHNIIGFDLPAIKDLYDVDLMENKKIIDTLVLSRLFNPTKEGGHSLESWGEKLGTKKISFDEFERYSEEMLTYCIQDVKLNVMVYKKLKEVMPNFSVQSIELEHCIAKIIKEQEKNGFKFDSLNADLLLAQLRERMQHIEEEVKRVFKPRWIDVKEVFPKLKKDGTLSKSGLTKDEFSNVLDKFKDEQMPDNYSFMRKKLEEFNLGSRKQIGEYLIQFGWKPKKFTPTGQPIVDELTLFQIDEIPEAKLIAEYLLVQKRIAQIQSWVDALEDDGRVHGFVIPNGTITGRMTHRNPNMDQVPSIHSPYGKECRACCVVEKNYRLIGIDASQLELRLLAHYMNNKEYIHDVTEGDIHATNQRLAGLESRDQAKTFIYAFIYGAGDAKIGSVVGGSTKDGERLRRNFLNNIPSLANLRSKVQGASKRGWLKGLDGRRLFIRTQHGALNTLLQGAGAIFMKQALVLLDKWAKCQGIDYKFVANIHDEWQVEIKEDQAELFGEMAVKSMIESGKLLNIRCPMTGEYKIGGDWSATH